MAVSATRPNAEHIAVAVSGGRDSTALLHCTARAVRGHGVTVHALHVHHGLMPDADAWVDHLRRQCRRWARSGLPVQLHINRLTASPPPGDSVEAWARRERYAALATMAVAADCDTVLLAQHRRDQAETFLLQALRGGAARGLAGMGGERHSRAVRWLRPWLAQSRDAIDAYVSRYRLSTIDDASNADVRFARGRLRRTVWPALLAAFPDAETTLAAAARRAQDAVVCLDALADIDLTGAFDDAGRLSVSALQSLGYERRRNAVAHALRRLMGRGAPESLVDRLCRETLSATLGRWPAPAGELRLYDGKLSFVPTAQAPAVSAVLAGDVVDLRHPGRYAVGDAGTLWVRPARAGGLSTAVLGAVHWRVRSGGERFQLEAASLPRSLKKQFQARRTPPWARSAPLLYANEQLVFVPGLGIDARVWAGSGPRRLLTWLPAAEPGA